MIVLEAEIAEAFGDSIKSRSFGLLPKRIVGIGAVYDLAQEFKRRVAVEAILFKNRFKGALAALVPELNVFHVERRCAQANSLAHNLIPGDIIELRLGINELLNEPGTGDPIDPGLFSSDPAHTLPRFGSLNSDLF